MIITFIICLLILVLGISYAIHLLRIELEIRNMFTRGYTLKLRDIVTFSNRELAKRIKRYNKRVRIDCPVGIHGEVFIISPDDDILYELSEMQKFLTKEQQDGKFVIEDNIDKIMIDLWLDYSYKDKYKVIFKRQLYHMLEKEEISTYTFNEVYRRFFKIK